MNKKLKSITLLVLSTTCITSLIGLSNWVIAANRNYTIDNKIETEPVAYILGSNIKYTSIEKALEMANSGDIVCLIPPTKKNYNEIDNAVLPDQVVYKISKDCEIKPGVTLVIPTDQDTLSTVTDASSLNNYISSMQSDDRTRGNNSSYATYATNYESRYLRVTLEIEDNVTLKNNGTLVVSGYLSGGTSSACTLGQTSHSYSRILLGNNAKIIQDNENAVTYCYGYISELNSNNSSQVNFNKGTLYIPFIVNDYRGFNFSWAMTDGAIDEQRCSPFNQFELRNIDALVNINYQTTVYGVTNVYLTYASMGIEKVFTQILNVVGNTSSFFLQLTDSTYSSIQYKFDKNSEVANVKIYGGMQLNDFQLQLKESIVTVDLSTTEAYFPLSYRFNVELLAAENQDSATFDITKQRMKLLPGSQLTIHDKCVLNANEIIVYSAFYDGTLGNGESSFNGYNSKKYPLKEGATLKVLDTGKITATKLAGTIYGEINNISFTTDTITSKEAWSLKSSGSLAPAWTIGEYLEINEKLNVVPVSYLEEKQQLFIGTNVFTNYKSFAPSFDVLINDGAESHTISTYQEVLHYDEIFNYQLKFNNNVYKAYYDDTYYSKNDVISYSEENSKLGVVNSVLSISNNNNGVNEFDVQSIEVSCSTPPINGKIPLYIGKNISLTATVNDINKAYDKTITWTSLDTNIATVSQTGIVTGVSLGKTTIQVECDGVISTFDVEVIEEIAVDEIESVYITDNNGKSSEVVDGQSNWGGNTKSDYHGKYGNNESITFTININPSSAPYSSIEWTLKASAAGRQYINDNTLTTETVKNQTSIVVHTGSGTGASDDEATLTCVVTGLDGTKYTATFILNHEADTSVCFEAGTLVMTNHGEKKIEEVQATDYVLSFNHFTGNYEYKPIAAVIAHGIQVYDVLELRFDDGSYIGFINNHGLFDVTLNRYVDFTNDNYLSYIGHQFIKHYQNKHQIITLKEAKIVKKVTNSYTLVSSENLNCVANGLLNITSVLYGIYNIFDYDENYCYNHQQVELEIKKYGLYTYDDFKEIISEKIFIDYGFRYFKISISKGLMTKETLIYYIHWLHSCIQNGEAIIY